MKNLLVMKLFCTLMVLCNAAYAMKVDQYTAVARAKSLLELGKLLIKSKEYEKAKDYLEECARQEDDKQRAALACMHLAKLYYFGWGVAQDRDKTAQLVDQGDVCMTAYLEDQGNPPTIFRPDIMEITEFGRILKYDVDPHKKGSYSSPLESAVLLGHSEVLELLIAKGANIEKMRDSSYWSALQSAVFAKNDSESQSVIEILLEHGARLYSNDNDWNALTSAACLGNVPLAALFVEKGAHVDHVDNSGKTALHCASERGHVEVVQLLLLKGAYIEAVTRKKGRTPLHLAAYRDHKEVVKLLLENGANRNAVDNQGKRPYDLVDDEMLKLLK